MHLYLSEYADSLTNTSLPKKCTALPPPFCSLGSIGELCTQLSPFRRGDNQKISNFPTFMSPVSPVFHILKTVRLSLNSIGNKTPSPDNIMSMLDSRALKFFSLISSLCKQGKNNMLLPFLLPTPSLAS